MANSMPVASAYDFAGLAALKSSAKRDGADQKSVNAKVAAEFEALFLKMMTDSMKASIKPLQSDLLRSDSMDFFDDMFYDEVSNVMADSQSLGIADWLDSVTDVRSGAAAKPQDRQAYPIDPRAGYRPARFN